jgi:hypothetical protein
MWRLEFISAVFSVWIYKYCSQLLWGGFEDACKVDERNCTGIDAASLREWKLRNNIGKGANVLFE